MNVFLSALRRRSRPASQKGKGVPSRFGMPPVRNRLPTRLPFLEALEDRLTPAQLSVTSALDPVSLTPGTLRYAVNQANVDTVNGVSDTIMFNTAAMGTSNITLQRGQLELTAGTGTTMIDGGGSILISGNDTGRVFQVDAGVTAIFTRLYIANGLVTGSLAQGGGIYNAGNLTLSDVTVLGNRAIGTPGGVAEGGGVFNSTSGNLTLNNEAIVGGNTATGESGADGNPGSDGANGFPGAPGGAGASALGGGIYNDGSTVTIDDSSLIGNAAQGGSGGSGGLGGNATVSTFGNPGDGGGGGEGGQGGQALGGGIYNNDGVVTVTGLGIGWQGNTVTGGPGGGGGGGGAGFPEGLEPSTGLLLIGGMGGPGGLGGLGGQALGGGIYNSGGLVNVSSSSASPLLELTGSASGGAGGTGGGGGGGGASGGNGWNGAVGGLAAGGAIYNTDNGTLLVQAPNGGVLEGTATGGTGGYGGGGGPGVAGPFNDGSYIPIGGNAGLANVGGEAEGGGVCDGTGSVAIIGYPNPSGTPLDLAGEAIGGQGGFGGNGGTPAPFGISTSGAAGGLAAGGALYNGAGEVSLSDVQIEGELQGGTGGNGGAFPIPAADVALGDGGPGGQAWGGGIYSGGGTVTVDSSTFNSNDEDFPFPVPGAVGGAGGASSPGAAAASYVGGNGGDALGGAIDVAGGTFALTNSTLSSSTTGGTGGSGGIGIGAPFGGVGGNGGNASGGAIELSNGTMYVTNSTFSGNEASGGAGGVNEQVAVVSSSGNGEGGAISVTGGTLYLNSSTLSANQANAGASAPDGTSGSGLGGGLFVLGPPVPIPPFGAVGGTVQIENTIVAANSASAADPDIDGTVTSAGYNLVGDGTGSSGFGSPGDQVGSAANPINPMLAPLQNNGGPTETMALLPGSPAIDAGGGPNTPGTDQRGVSRPQGSALCIGAFEFSIPLSTVHVLPNFSPLAFTVSWSDTNGTTPSIAYYTIYVSDDGGPFTPWLLPSSSGSLSSQTTLTRATYNGQDGHTYAFYSVATDDDGNVQPTPTAAQTTTTVRVTPINPAATGTALGAPLLTPLAGVDTVTLTASVTVIPPGGGGPTGSVDFFDTTAGTDLGNAPLSGGTATLTLPPLAAGPHVLRATYSGDGNFLSSSGTLSLTALVPASLSGSVFADFNDDGQIDFGENGISGVSVRLTGTDDLGHAVDRTLQTDGAGAYVFLNLRPGSYYLTRTTQPTGYSPGIDSVGTAGGSLSTTVADQFFITLAQGVKGLNYNYGERQAATGPLQKGQTAGIGFWNKKNGQALILAFNGGGTSHELGDWLAATFVNLYGAGSANDLAGKSNAYIAALVQQDFREKGPKLDAQVLATALSVYATNATLDSTQAAAAYGFTVSGYGLGTATVNVGSNGGAFGVANNTTMTVMDLLLATNDQAVMGLLYNGNTAKRNMANNVYSTLNDAGSIG